jgi:hypothetical protein
MDKDPPCHYATNTVSGSSFLLYAVLWNRKSADKPDDFEWIRKKEAAQVYTSAYVYICAPLKRA